MWPGGAQIPWRKTTSATTGLLSAVRSKPRICLEKFTHAFFKSHLKNQRGLLSCSKGIAHSGKKKNYARTVGIPAEGAAHTEGD